MSEKATNDDKPVDDGSGKESVDGNKSDEPPPEAKPEAQAATTEEYPQGFAFAMIMTATLSSLFLVALVISASHPSCN